MGMGTSRTCALLALLWVWEPLAGCVSSEPRNGQSGQDGQDAQTEEPPVQDQDTCTRAGCGPAITLHAPISDAIAALPSLSVDICLNDACLSGTLQKVDAAGRWGGRFQEPVDGPRAMASMDRSPGSAHFWAEYTPWSLDDLRDGDRFSVTVRDPEGNVVFSASRTITYMERYPNGRGCTPRCLTATIEVENTTDSD
jgi:hypothetical protein